MKMILSFLVGLLRRVFSKLTMSATADTIASLTGFEVARVRRQRGICWIRCITGILVQQFLHGSRGICLHEDQAGWLAFGDRFRTRLSSGGWLSQNVPRDTYPSVCLQQRDTRTIRLFAATTDTRTIRLFTGDEGESFAVSAVSERGRELLQSHAEQRTPPES